MIDFIGEKMSNKMEEILINLLEDYKKNGESAILNPYAFFMEQKIFIKLDETGEIRRKLLLELFLLFLEVCFK